MLRTLLLSSLVSASMLGCGDDSAGSGGAGGATESSGGPAASSASQSASSTGAGATSAGGGSTAEGGGGAAAGPGGGGQGGAPTEVDCSGDWTRAAEPVLELGAVVLQSVAVSRAERELHLVIRPGGATRAIAARSVRARSTDPFPPPVFAPDLDALCDATHEPFLDVSEDGLRAYVTCTPLGGESQLCPPTGCEILLAERANPAQSFELSGVVGRAGFHPSVSADELAVVTNGLTATDGAMPRIATRDDRGEDFGPALELDVPSEDIARISGATLSADGLELYAYARAAPTEPGLARAKRLDRMAPFEPFVPIDAWAGAVLAVGSPDLTPDCRTLYVIRQAETGHGIDVLRR